MESPQAPHSLQVEWSMRRAGPLGGRKLVSGGTKQRAAQGGDQSPEPGGGGGRRGGYHGGLTEITPLYPVRPS